VCVCAKIIEDNSLIHTADDNATLKYPVESCQKSHGVHWIHN